MSYRDPLTSRPGFTTVEALVTVSTGAVLVAGIASAIVAVSRLERAAADRAETVAAHAHAATVLSHELRTLDTRRDGFGMGPDSIKLRAFRGRAIVCGGDSSAAAVRYDGLRMPDPSKDSRLVLAGAGAERSLPLVAAVPSVVCSPRPGEVGLQLRPGAGLVPGDVVLVHENGSYHLATGALRYRRGAGGRQPLTPTVFFDDSTGLALATVMLPGVAAGTAGVHIRTAAGTAAADRFSTRATFLNLAIPFDSVPVP
jgi:hypothetical protein